MNGSGGSWRDFSAKIGGGARRSSAWTTLLSVPASGCLKTPTGPSSSLFPSVSTENFLDCIKVPGQHGIAGSGTSSLPGSSLFLDSLLGGKSGGSENHKRAASEFVLELAGPMERGHPAGMHGTRGTLLSSEELPVPMFSINRDLRCTMWNSRLTDLTGWSEDDVMVMPGFPHCILSLEDNKGSLESLLKLASSGDDISGVTIRFQCKNGRPIRALLYGCQQSLGGFTCVIMGQNRTHNSAQQPETDSETKAQPMGRGFDERVETACDVSAEPSTPVTPAQEGETWVKSSKRNREGSSDSLTTSPTTLDPSPVGYNSAMALVVSSTSPSASILSSQLERCGVEVVGATSAREAMWRLQKSLEEEEVEVEMGGVQGVSLIFLELEAASNDGYAAVKEIRKMEKAYLGERQRTMVVAVTNMNRWDLAGMDNFMDRGIDVGVDAIIPQHIQMQQLRTTLRKLGVQSKYLQVPAPLPRALSGNIHNPLNLTR